MGKNKTLDLFNYHEITNRLVLGSIPHEREHIEQLQRIGVDSILSLTETPIFANIEKLTPFTDFREFMFFKSMYHAWYPFPDGGIPQLQDLLSMYEFINKEATKTYIHCRGGVGRSGIVAIGYLRHKGHSLDEAKRLVAKRHNRVNLKAGPVTQIQRDFIEGLA